ncbi:related to PHO36 (regulatory role in lipid and phosphate metabolism) [Cephalotrichum gorgonifer]|uniref:Related to PHO36 (Regulatory role in lipid and phosphate metabolism) n=1 Tax=Cephalotrichum gorgonifer TaxID=2041049 RepID=A0AAE8SWQ0_9PEZI|nr:related to PHO36 (regulatory role in lipid and phosphate metabolism) [Cephalotrichum gorgonifer]
MNPPSEPTVRRRRASITETLLTQASHLESELASSLLILWDDLPSWRRDNAFILSGYRRSTASFSDCFGSLGYLHNETVNIYSHLLGSAAFLSAAALCLSVIRPRYAAASDADLLVFGCFFAGAVLCLGMSAVYHAVSSHSEAVSRWGNKLDYSGIVFLIVGSFVPTLYYGFFCEPELMTIYLGIISTLGFACGLVSWIDRFRTPEWRPYRAGMFVGLGTSGVFPILHGIQIYGFKGMDERMSLRLVALHGLVYIIGAVLYAARWPERTMPGKFDIWGSSHQIFHVCVLIAAGIHLYAMAQAFDHHHTVMGSQCS